VLVTKVTAGTKMGQRGQSMAAIGQSTCSSDVPLRALWVRSSADKIQQKYGFAGGRDSETLPCGIPRATLGAHAAARHPAAGALLPGWTNTGSSARSVICRSNLPLAVPAKPVYSLCGCRRPFGRHTLRARMEDNLEPLRSKPDAGFRVVCRLTFR
jgi:hypothetical protein